MPFRFQRIFLILPFIALLALNSKAAPFTAVYSFGDSLSDAGNLRAAVGIPAAPYVNGHFSNGDVWVQNVAASWGLSSLTASLLGGNDYAFGGALSGASPFHAAATIDLPAQLALFKAAHPTADPNALYTVWIGSNDVNAILGTTPTPGQLAIDVGTVVANIDSAITSLAALGAKNILVLTVPDLGKSPRAIAAGPAGVAAASAVSGAIDNLLLNGQGSIPSLNALALANSLNLRVFDTYSFIDTIAANPGSYGLANVTAPCLVGSVNYVGGTPCANPNQYLFWDDLHPTAYGHSLLANAVLQAAVPEPATLTMMGAALLALLLLVSKSRARAVC